MGVIELVIIAISLAMDAFAVSICKGLNMVKINYRHGLILALFFGVFQALMPLLGWVLGTQLADYISSIDHWIAFFLLAFIGGKMIADTYKNEQEDNTYIDKLDMRELVLLSVATSIDALAVGITFALLPETNIVLSIILIGVITFAISFVGVIIGNKFGNKFEKTAQFAGGFVLILIGLKILFEHLEIIVF